MYTPTHHTRTDGSTRATVVNADPTAPGGAVTIKIATPDQPAPEQLTLTEDAARALRDALITWDPNVFLNRHHRGLIAAIEGSRAERDHARQQLADLQSAYTDLYRTLDALHAA